MDEYIESIIKLINSLLNIRNSVIEQEKFLCSYFYYKLLQLRSEENQFEIHV